MSYNTKKILSKLGPFHILTIIFISSIIIVSNEASFSQSDIIINEQQSNASHDRQNRFIIFVNLERILYQLSLTEYNLDSNNLDNAFSHAYTSHSTILPSILDDLQQIDTSLTSKLQVYLTELPLFIKDIKNKPKSEIMSIISDTKILTELLSNKTIELPSIKNNQFTLQSSLVLLRDASKIYEIVKISDPRVQTQFDYKYILEIIKRSKSQFNELSNLNIETRNSIISLYSNIEKNLTGKGNTDLSSLIDSLESKLLSISIDVVKTLSEDYQKYFFNIRSLLGTVITEVKENNDYKKADKSAMSAYLDNYEYLEAPLEKNDPQFMVEIELDMREELRALLKNNTQPKVIEVFVTNLLEKINTAEEILLNDKSIVAKIGNTKLENNLADIEELSKGFGTFSGERKQMGDLADSTKQYVRNDVDQIRINLQKILDLYNKGDYHNALLVSRSTYLDSYENIEIPLRPIDPDFTLDMEIKFAELRNIIENRAGSEQVMMKINSIQDGLDESERLVSGIGSIAPGIAFSASFSIIFREGLESALIIGAILTYLEASRNERFKKHVYYGIFIAAGATALTWIIATYLIKLSGANRELIEAIAGISAVAVLFWVSFWVLNKIETKKWIEFVKSKIWKAASTGSITVFVLLSFFTVYREGFETVLFYQAILSYAKHMEIFVISGMLIGLAIIVSIAYLVIKLGKKLPLRILFGLTMAIGAYMSITFLGNAVREFQELGYISTTHLFGIIPRLDVNLATLTGIHPTLETIVAQIILLSVYLVGSLYILIIQPRRRKIIESSRKSMADFK